MLENQALHYQTHDFREIFFILKNLKKNNKLLFCFKKNNFV